MIQVLFILFVLAIVAEFNKRRLKGPLVRGLESSSFSTARVVKTVTVLVIIGIAIFMYAFIQGYKGYIL